MTRPPGGRRAPLRPERDGEALGTARWETKAAASPSTRHGADGRGTGADREQVFFNAPLVAASDAAHSEQEERFYVLGQTDAGRRLFVVFTLRGERIRVISARDMSRKERALYDGA